METSSLKEIGLTESEIKVYTSLLSLGPSNASPIMEKANLQSSVLHLALNGLIKKGFVSSIKNGKRNNYQATEPKYLLQFIEDKKKKVEELIPELIKKQNSAKEKSEVTSFKGIRGIKELLYELLDAGGKEHHTFGSAKESLMMGDTFWLNYHQKRVSKGIKAKLLFNKSLKEWVEKNKYPSAEYKFTQIGFEPLTETIIRNDKIGIIVWTEIPLGILIHNKIASESYEKFFEVLWKQAKK